MLAPSQYRRGATGKAIGPPSLMDFTRSHLHTFPPRRTTIHDDHRRGLRTPVERLEWNVSVSVAPRAASAVHAPTVRATVLSRVWPTRVCARYTSSSSYSSAYLSLLLEGPRSTL